MKFNSLTYLVFLSTTLLLYYNLRHTGRLLMLTAASILFYAFWNVPLVGLIVIQAVIDFAAGLVLEKHSGARVRHATLVTSMTVNLGILAFFKYANFFYESVNALLGDGEAGRIVNVLLPPGISFYTFHSMSYTIDCYRGVIRPTRSFTRFFLYVMFFPQLVAGPIARASHLLTQFDYAARERFSPENFATGLRMIIWGLFKKVMVADYCAVFANRVYDDPGAYDGWSALIATYAFTMQIYFDFSAYSEIARGSARMFGIDLMQNFDQPYLSADVSQFWRRWHISLSTWFRDYLYVPLGGSQCGRARALMNLVITMFLSGLWHGAAWNFVLWGLLHGTLLLIHALVTKLPGYARLRELGGTPWKLTAWFITFHAVVTGWILFRVESIRDFWTVAGSILRIPSEWISPSPAQLAFLGLVALILLMSHLKRRYHLQDLIDGDFGVSTAFYGAVAVVTVIFAQSEGPQFIYFQF